MEKIEFPGMQSFTMRESGESGDVFPEFEKW